VDLMSLATLHLFFLYVAAARLYNTEIRVISALWRLFRGSYRPPARSAIQSFPVAGVVVRGHSCSRAGRKWNELRQRVDSAQFDVDQLLLGTLGFVVACFLLPTIAVYYLFLTITHVTLTLWCARHLLLRAAQPALTPLTARCCWRPLWPCLTTSLCTSCLCTCSTAGACPVRSALHRLYMSADCLGLQAVCMWRCFRRAVPPPPAALVAAAATSGAGCWRVRLAGGAPPDRRVTWSTVRRSEWARSRWPPRPAPHGSSWPLRWRRQRVAVRG
jgi:hypothetical protein